MIESKFSNNSHHPTDNHHRIDNVLQGTATDALEASGTYG